MIALVMALTTVGTAIWVETSLRRITVFNDYDGRPSAGAGTNWLLVARTAGRTSARAAGRTGHRRRRRQRANRHDPARAHPGSAVRRHATMVSIPGLLREHPRPRLGQDQLPPSPTAARRRWPRPSSRTPVFASTITPRSGLPVFGQVGRRPGGCGSVPPIRSTTHWPGSIWRPGARSWTEPRHWLRPDPRHTAFDLDRMVHQREFMSAMLNRAEIRGCG